MRALVEPSGRVAQVAAEEFPVHPSLEWVECGAEVVAGWRYQGGAFVPPAPPDENATIRAQLAANDLKIIRALAEGDAPRIAAHNAAQAALRAQLKP